MARRSVSNPRYQKDAKVGKTRRSAASAKPKRGAGERGPSEKKPEKKRRFEVVTTPEIKVQRKRWWVFMGAALLAATALLAPQIQENSALQSIAIAVWAAAFFAAVYIDWFVIRKLRKAEIERRKKEGKKGT